MKKVQTKRRRGGRPSSPRRGPASLADWLTTRQRRGVPPAAAALAILGAKIAVRVAPNLCRMVERMRTWTIPAEWHRFWRQCWLFPRFSFLKVLDSAWERGAFSLPAEFEGVRPSVAVRLLPFFLKSLRRCSPDELRELLAAEKVPDEIPDLDLRRVWNSMIESLCEPMRVDADDSPWLWQVDECALATAFVAGVCVPCLLQHQTDPWRLYRSAAGGDVNAAVRVLEVDPFAGSLPEVQRVIEDAIRAGRRGDVERLTTARNVSKGFSISPKAVRLAVAAVVMQYTELLAVAVDAPSRALRPKDLLELYGLLGRPDATDIGSDAGLRVELKRWRQRLPLFGRDMLSRLGVTV